ncbi:MAG: HAD hydrolase-like protein, partial [Paenibacillus sp.]|nr:HAD hydrolase-like protein [Paenibacillus sp.]
SIDALEGILQQLKLDRTNTWMIGNSLRTDVLPALTNGIHAIYLKQRTEWSFNIVDLDVKPQGAFYTVEKLTEVPSKIHNWVTDARAHV